MREKMRGLIIRETNLGEADKILTVLTEDHGKVSILAKNIRRVKGRFGAGAAFLCYSDFEADTSKTELYYLRQAVPVHNFFGLSEQIEKLALATYLGQLAAACVPEGFAETGKKTLQLLLNTFHVLTTTDKELRFVKSVFELRLMAEEGYAPDMEACAVCGKLAFPLFLHLQEGVVVCDSCRQKASGGFCLNETLYKAIRYIMCADLKKLYSFAIGKENAESLSALAEAYCLCHAGREIPALSYLKSFI